MKLDEIEAKKITAARKSLLKHLGSPDWINLIVFGMVPGRDGPQLIVRGHVPDGVLPDEWEGYGVCIE